MIKHFILLFVWCHLALAWDSSCPHVESVAPQSGVVLDTSPTNNNAFTITFSHNVSMMSGGVLTPLSSLSSSNLNQIFIVAGSKPISLARNSFVSFPSAVSLNLAAPGRSLIVSFRLSISASDYYADLMLADVFYLTKSGKSLPFSSPATYRLQNVAPDTCLANIASPVTSLCSFVDASSVPSTPVSSPTWSGTINEELAVSDPSQISFCKRRGIAQFESLLTTQVNISVNIQNSGSASSSLGAIKLTHQDVEYELLSDWVVSIQRNDTKFVVPTIPNTQRYYDAMEVSRGRIANSTYLAGLVDTSVSSATVQTFLNAASAGSLTLIVLNLAPEQAWDYVDSWTTTSQYESGLSTAQLRFANLSAGTSTFINFNSVWTIRQETGVDCSGCAARKAFCPFCSLEYHQLVQDTSVPFRAFQPVSDINQFLPSHGVQMTLLAQGVPVTTVVPRTLGSTMWTSPEIRPSTFFDVRGLYQASAFSNISERVMLQSSSEQISTEAQFIGSSCNQIGVSFQSFTAQSNFCNLPFGSCLQNQISQLRRSAENYTPFHHPALAGSVSCATGLCSRALLQPDNSSLELQVYQVVPLSVTLRLSANDVVLKEPFLSQSRSGWLAAAAAPGCDLDFEPSVVQYQENEGTLDVSFTNLGETDGAVGITVTCQGLMVQGSPVMMAASVNNLTSVRFSVSVPSALNQSYSNASCTATIAVQRLPLWSALGKSVSCVSSIPIYAGYFLPPCNLTRPGAILGLSVQNVSLDGVDTSVLNTNGNRTQARLMITFENTGIPALAVVKTLCTPGYVLVGVPGNIYLSGASVGVSAFVLRSTAPGVSSTCSCHFEVYAHHPTPNCSVIVSQAQASVSFAGSSLSTPSDASDDSSFFDGLRDAFGNYSDGVVGVILALIIILGAGAIIVVIVVYRIHRRSATKSVLLPFSESRSTRHDYMDVGVTNVASSDPTYESSSSPVIYANVDATASGTAHYADVGELLYKANDATRVTMHDSTEAASNQAVVCTEGDPCLQPYLQTGPNGSFMCLTDFTANCVDGTHSWESLQSISSVTGYLVGEVRLILLDSRNTENEYS
ncbi:hypothetical protein, variant 4 [Capsaspora owczarzaki ATCC 30864]|uniref:Generative cell specific-1/HAP2 domain-containing protein n=2 Tax=Capsaspora owczarzaki (strain ATCC 30864) TaxID=595528 RepID=A0A0D2VU57_CAPO3|nr:hypothetical protein, variant 3 [Capsaspora owczarzaki ATCC 30864]KJE94898.1 hypothetical protein, variant 4 [Capsaspora owczarzaki ATCC 30864]